MSSSMDSINTERHDPINHPPHYNPDGIEAISVIEDWKLNFHLGCVVKYICRFNKKSPLDPLMDLLKARWYLDRFIGLVSDLRDPKGKTKTQEQSTKDLTLADRDFMLALTDDLWSLTLREIFKSPQEATRLSKDQANRIARAVTLAFQTALKKELGVKE